MLQQRHRLVVDRIVFCVGQGIYYQSEWLIAPSGVIGWGESRRPKSGRNERRRHPNQRLGPRRIMRRHERRRRPGHRRRSRYRILGQRIAPDTARHHVDSRLVNRLVNRVMNRHHRRRGEKLDPGSAMFFRIVPSPSTAFRILPLMSIRRMSFETCPERRSCSNHASSRRHASGTRPPSCGPFLTTCDTALIATGKSLGPMTMSATIPIKPISVHAMSNIPAF